MKKDSAAIVCPSLPYCKVWDFFLKDYKNFAIFNRQTWAGCETERGQRTTPI